MDYRKLGFGLGIFSLALGAAEIFGARRIAKGFDAAGQEGLVRGFGAREVLAGVNLVVAPAVATNVWNRVAGDVMDIAATGAAARNSPRNPLTWAALAFVTGALALDAWVALGLDRETGKTLPTREALAA